MTTIDEFFAGKPEAQAVFGVLDERIRSASPQASLTVGKQISYGGRRKFAWIWLYNVTLRNPNGIVHLMLALPTAHESERTAGHVRHIEQIGARRWNHQIVVRTLDHAGSAWLGRLIAEAAAYGEG